MGDDLRGQRIGKYEVLTHLSMGGMAELFLGCTSGPGGFRKYVVIKRILPDAASDESFMRMFLDEARITAGFSHPGIAQVYDLGQDDDGFYVVMEFIAGRNLNEVTAACAKSQSVLPLGFSVSAVHDAVLALHYAHTYKKPSGEAYPVIHRDVAQKNIMVTYDGQVKLLDFGVAKARGSLARTKIGTVKGTAGYMSPEQVRGEGIDSRSDLFTAGVVLWEMVTGQRLFSADTELQEMRMILEKRIEAPSDVEPVVPEELSAVVMKSLESDPSKRFQNGKDFARALAKCDEFFFDVDQRTTFMRELFEANIKKTQALFDATDSNVSFKQLERVVEAYRQSAPEPEPEGKPRQKLKVGGVRKRRRAKEAATDENLQLVVLQAQAEAQAASSQPRRQWSGVFFAAVLALLVAVVGWKMLQPAPRTKSGVKAFNGEELLVDDPLKVADPNLSPLNPIDTIPGTPTAPDPDPTAPAQAGSAPIVVAQQNDGPKKVFEKPRAPMPGPGEVTLALLPEGATVLKGKQELGKGLWVTFSVPSGVHTLTVVGPDQVKRALVLTVVGGKNKPQKFRVDELPLQ